MPVAVTMSRISTGTGDEGETGLVGGARVSKTDARVEAYGTVDELNDVLGLAASFGSDGLREELRPLQRDLLTLGADLANPDADPEKGTRVGAEHVERLEARTDELERELPELRNFILPGGERSAAFLQLARSVCRRAERLAWRLREDHDVNPRALVYLNRLSDLLFLMARKVNVDAGVEEERWSRQG